MIRLSLNLSPRYRLDLSLIKSRKKPDVVSIVPKPGKIFSIKKGSKISRIFRHVFSHNKINKFLGINLAALFLSSALTQTPVSVQGKESDSPLTEVPIVLQTKHGVQYPVKQIKITQGYRLFHPGLDLDGKTGDPIYPIMAGRVEAIDRSKYGYGNAIILNHGNDITSLYAHLSRIEVSVNQDVTVDTEIGKMGATGRASGDHLHLEIRDHGKAINPLTILSR